MTGPETIRAWQPAPEGMPAWLAAGHTALSAGPHPAARPGRPA
jgi:hypothetical protein